MSLYLPALLPILTRGVFLKRELDCVTPCSSVLCSHSCSSIQPHWLLFCSSSELPLGKWEKVHPLDGQIRERILFPQPDACHQCKPVQLNLVVQPCTSQASDREDFDTWEEWKEHGP